MIFGISWTHDPWGISRRPANSHLETIHPSCARRGHALELDADQGTKTREPLCRQSVDLVRDQRAHLGRAPIDDAQKRIFPSQIPSMRKAKVNQHGDIGKVEHYIGRLDVVMGYTTLV